MKNYNWKDKKIAVLGYGVEGRSSVEYFLKHGARVDVHDALPLQKLHQESLLRHQDAGVKFALEEAAFGDLESYDLVMRTPTFSPFHPALAKLDSQQVSSQTNLFLDAWRDHMIGITGTKGKGTTASLLHHILISSGKKTLIGGNIGTPLLDIMDSMTPDHIAVAELSSYQLWDARISPHMAILLAVYPEHLDVHGSLDSYLAAKQNILRYQQRNDTAIVCTDSPLSKHICNLMPARQYKIASGWSENGATLDGLQASIATDTTAFAVSVNDTKLRGAHNAGNLAAAVVAAVLHGVDESSIRQALPTFTPLPHRLELVKTVEGVSFYDDSIATTPEATIAALKSFDQPLVVWLGGINPSADWQQLAGPLSAENIKGCVLLGTSASDIQQLISEKDINLPVLMRPESFDQAITWSAQKLATVKDGVVLLSPGAKSLDQFVNYKQRGEAFQQAVARFAKAN